MKPLLALALCAAALAFGPVQAASPAQKAQQEKMRQCNKDAADKKGDERKAFMKDCLSAKPAAQGSQQDKMKSCNAEAAGKTGDERKKFMSECLKG